MWYLCTLESSSAERKLLLTRKCLELEIIIPSEIVNTYNLDFKRKSLQDMEVKGDYLGGRKDLMGGWNERG